MNTRTLVTLGALAGAGAGVLKWLRQPLHNQNRTLIDWEAVRDRAKRRAKNGEEATSDATYSHLEAQYIEQASLLLPHLNGAWGYPLSALPPIQVVGRSGFIDANLSMMKRIVSALYASQHSRPETRLTAINRQISSTYIGEAFGATSRRVLGQYDPILGRGLSSPPSTESATLFMVEENIADIEATYHISGEDIRGWIMMHELTHAWQFTTHPWLDTYFTSIMQQAIHLKAPKGINALRSLPTLVQDEVALIGKLQSVMSIIEGHANYVTRRVARTHLASFDAIEATFERRQSTQTLPERILYALTGISIKMRQYAVGEAFLGAVAERHGEDVLELLWHSIDHFPTPNELKHPDSWFERVSALPKAPLSAAGIY